MKMGQRERGKEGVREGEKGGEEEAQTDHVILPKANRANSGIETVIQGPRLPHSCLPLPGSLSQ